MENKAFESNTVSLVGEVVSEFTFSHEVFGEGFYFIELAVDRESNTTDYIPILVSERLMDVKEDIKGKLLYVSGQYRSFNKHEGTNNKLVLSVFAREIELLDSIDYKHINNVYLEGTVCKEPNYRKTPLGREITDLIIAVNRGYGKSDYIPCICWGRTARFVSTFEVGVKAKIYGRVQSRNYIKKISENECEERVAYEISVSRVEL